MKKIILIITISFFHSIVIAKNIESSLCQNYHIEANNSITCCSANDSGEYPSLITSLHFTSACFEEPNGQVCCEKNNKQMTPTTPSLKYPKLN